MREKGKNRSVLGSTFARIVAFFLLAISFATGVAGTILTMMLWEEEAYTNGMPSVIREAMSGQVWNDVNYIKVLYQEGDIAGMEQYLDKRNGAVEILDYDVPEGEEAILLWSNYDGFETSFSYNCFTSIRERIPMATEEAVDEEDVGESVEIDIVDESVYIPHMDEAYEMEDVAETFYVQPKNLLVRVHVDENFPYEDAYRSMYQLGRTIGELLYVIPVVALVSVFLFLCCFIFLMCSAGHHGSREGITGGVLYFFYFDLVTVVFVTIAIMLMVAAVEFVSYGSVLEVVVGFVLLMLDVVWVTIYCMEAAVELKKGTIFKHTLIYTLLSKCERGVKKLWQMFVTMLRGLPLVAGALIAYGAFSVVQFFVLLFFCELWSMDGDVLLLCLLEKIVLLPLVLYFALVCKKLQQGSEALAEGNLTYKLDTDKMILGFKKHGESLNRIGEGIAVAVDERMKSEHLKTELITNVSHDLKTPLTSIINYADLIGTMAKNRDINDGLGVTEKEMLPEAMEGETIDRVQLAEYSEVLLRQSKRLKKLLEDLVEASKATTGNLEVNLMPCEVGVILSQAIGEYAQRFAEKELELLVKQPEEPVSIMADGRHLWRVFDNLMNNICKYAQENTRVYLTVAPKRETVEIIFRNMSKYALDVSAEELQERFVRGDKSRHMEGNGLGLSIAGSLVELQNGQMEIVVDGDLFKVILRFPVLA